MLSFIITAIIATLLTPIIVRWYTKRGWLDNPEVDKHVKKTHQRPVPRGGGVVIFIAVLTAAAFFLRWDIHLFAIMAGALLLTVVGFLDDIYDLHPLIRMGTGLLAAVIVVGSGIGIAYVTNPFSGGVLHLDQPRLNFMFMGDVRSIWILADLFAVLFIIWNMNIVNWAKGVDGQMPGFVSIALIFVGILSFSFIDDPTQFDAAHLAFIAAGAFAGLLVWNWYPQKILPGYGAGSLAGYFLAVLAIVSGAKVATTLMVLALPTADAIFTIGRRILAGKSPFWGDRGHLHHKLLDVLGWGRRRIALFYWTVTLLMGFLSLYLNSLGKFIAVASTLILVFAVLLWFRLKQRSESAIIKA
ncbi:MAG: undecaprenyl/decaprenyl-phosphate alpha-N-acetylglucosaminyl 1-phosphate transferase [bacterium]|nr:undecaprenyl/decaprenyl-phosphate alpha-N-acetylglucosaminyl 1-phosphate transferase [bacterium]